MTAKLPDIDLSLLTSSAQIFSSTGPNNSTTAATSSTGQNVTSYNYTLPQIRALHKQIHLAIDDKKSRLRTQVGGSYRELLGTADAIVRMRGEMDEVQRILGTMGARCGRGVVGAKANGLARLTGEREAVALLGGGDTAGIVKKDLAGVARAKLLAGCVLALNLLLKDFNKKPVVQTHSSHNQHHNSAQSQNQPQAHEGEQLVVAAKVFVLGRLLAESFEENKPDVRIKSKVAASVQSLNKLRKRLWKRIDKVLEMVGETTNRNLVLSALRAYSLSTSSGARDIIQHFLDVRGRAMASVFEMDEPKSTTGHVVKGLKLYTKTILDVQYLVPNKLTEALVHLNREKLLSDPWLRQMEGLRLDIYERWCSDSIQTYKPSINHADLDGKHAVSMLTSWSTQGSEVLLAGLAKSLERTTEFKVLTEMRTEVLQLWIRDGGKVRGFDPSIMLDRLRQTINAHVMSVIDTKVHKLRLVGSEVAATLEVWQSGVTDAQQRLWAVGGSSSLDINLHHGAGPFAQDVIGRLYGRNDAVARAVTGYKSWALVIDDVEEVVERLKRQRWDNDVDEIEDEETIDERQQALSRDDPNKLQERLNVALERAFKDLDKHLVDLWNVANDSNANRGDKSGAIPMYLLRILRDIRARLPKLESIQSFGLEMVPSLQDKIARAVAIAPIDAFASSVLVRTTVVGRSLWDGSPELPTSPSPGIFRLLRNLSVAMSDAGMDLWSPAAVSSLKKIAGKELSGRWAAALEAQIARPEPVKENETSEKEVSPAVNEAEEIKVMEVGDDENEEALKEVDKLTADGKADEDGGKEAEVPVGDAEVTQDAQEAIQPGESSEIVKQRKDMLLQWLFDIAILKCSIAVDDMRELEETVWMKAELNDVLIRQRLHKSSQEYWKRSSLLFGLLS